MHEIKQEENEIQTNVTKSESILGTDLLQYETKVSNSFHGQISSSVAEARLRLFNVDRCYLTRESDVKPGRYILSCLVNGAVIHYSVPKANYDKLISGNFEHDKCKFPVFQPDTEKPVKITTYLKHTCYICTFLSLSAEDLKHHMSKHHNPVKITTYPKHTCYVCTFLCLSAKDLKHHMSKHHRLVECTFCNKFIFNDVLHHHKLNCSPDKHYLNCQLCDYKSLKSFDLKRHMEIHVKKPLICKLCGKCFENEDKLEKHQQFHKGLQHCCPYCDKKFKELKYFNYHIKHWHPNGTSVISGRPKGRTLHHCIVEGCGWKDKDRSLLENHMRSKHSDPKPKKMYKCEECNFVAHSQWRFKRHVESDRHQKKNAEYVYFF